MATYKVLQDIEAEDKLIGPFTLWQSIYFFVTGICIYLSVISVTKNVPLFLIVLLPVALFTGFLTIPWGGDQPTEVWALAKLRYFLKPRRRIWNQDGMNDLVTITVPKRVNQPLTDGLSQREVRSRLSALASTLDSRGWAVKNVNVNLSTQMLPAVAESDRLITLSAMPQEVTAIDVRPDDDILDETANTVAHNFKSMIEEATSKHRQKLVDLMNRPLPESSATSAAQSSASQAQMAPVAQAAIPMVPAAQSGVPQLQTPAMWFAPPTSQAVSTAATPPFASTVSSPFIPQAAEPTAAEEALAAQIKAENTQEDVAYSHLPIVKTPDQLAAESAEAAKIKAETEARVLSEKQAAIMNLARSNDHSVATIQKEARQLDDNDEVVIPLR